MTENEIDNIEVNTDRIDESPSPLNNRQKYLNISHHYVNHILSILYRFFSDCLLCRLVSFIFTLQAGIIWLGFAVNFILQLLFLPFGQHHAATFVGSYLMVPGTVAFSAHYFWYIIQTACHVFQRDVLSKEQSSTLENSLDRKCLPDVSDYILMFINSNMCVKRMYRLIITSLTIGYMSYYVTGDFWQMLIIPAGAIPLILMWTLKITHSIGMLCFVVVSSCHCIRNQLPSFRSNVTEGNQLNENTVRFNRTWTLTFSIVLIQIAIPLILQLLAILYQIAWFALFIIWLLFFGRTWPPKKNQCIYMCLCCCCVAPEMSNYLSDRRSKRLMTYKLFILFVLSTMITSLAYILRSRIDLKQSERIAIICVLSIASLFQLLLMIPSYLDFRFINIQIFVIHILMITASILVLIGIGLLLVNPNINMWIVIGCLMPLAIHLFLIFIYYLLHIFYDCKHRDKKYMNGLSLWIESHHDISIFRNTFYVIFVIMTIIGFSGLALCSSVFFHDEMPVNNKTLSGDMLIEYDRNSKENINKTENQMKACDWQFHSLKIQDLVLLAALAYRRPTEVKIELEKFFGTSNDLQFQVDESLSNYKEYGYGDVTYFTATTADVVIVSIRGTILLYEWLIDFDTWTESLIYQIISMLFPWSKLFPEALTSKIVQHMALLKKLSHQSDDSKRFYVLQMIQILKKIHQKYQNKKAFIVVGHSLGGGLAKLSGIALNFTNVLVSVSGPGITHAHATVDRTKDIPMETINQRIFNIYHDRDLVPWIDQQEGLTQIVTCPMKYKRLQCHYITPLFCHIVRLCGNPRRFKVNPDICIP